MVPSLHNVPQSVVGAEDVLEDLAGHHGAEPREDGEVFCTQLSCRVWSESRNVVTETKLTEDDMEELTPLAIAGLVKVEDDGYVSPNVHELDQGGGNGVGGDLRTKVP